MAHLSCFLSQIVFCMAMALGNFVDSFFFSFLILCYVIEPGSITGLYMYMHM